MLTSTLGEPSEYKIRKARESAAVSTIEAVVRALSIIEPEQDFQPLLKPFREMVEQQIQAMDDDVYRRNYSSFSSLACAMDATAKG